MERKGKDSQIKGSWESIFRVTDDFFRVALTHTTIHLTKGGEMVTIHHITIHHTTIHLTKGGEVVTIHHVTIHHTTIHLTKGGEVGTIHHITIDHTTIHLTKGDEVVTIHHTTIHLTKGLWWKEVMCDGEGWWWREVMRKGDDEGWWRRVMTKGGDEGWWLREVRAKWRLREVVTRVGAFCNSCMTVACGLLCGGSRSTKPCVFQGKMAAAGDGGYLVCSVVANALVSTHNRFFHGVLQRVAEQLLKPSWLYLFRISPGLVRSRAVHPRLSKWSAEHAGSRRHAWLQKSGSSCN